MDKIMSFNLFVNEAVKGKKEQKKIDELLDKGFKNLTAEEKELLNRLSQGGSLDDDDDERGGTPALKMHKTGGGYLYDDEGNVMTEEEDETTKPGQEFVTAKGKSSSIDKLEEDDILDARVYRQKDSENRVIYVYTTFETESGQTNGWIIYKTEGGPDFPFGQFANMESPKNAHLAHRTPAAMWAEKDWDFDYGMVLDEDFYEDFINFVQLYKEGALRNKDILLRLKSRFTKLL